MKTVVLRMCVMYLVCLTPGGAWAQKQGEEPIRLSASMDLTDSQRRQLESDALEGSPEAARTLANFHFIVRGDREATLRWYTVGAENGDSSCQYALYGLLKVESNPDTRLRAHFWLKKAADGGLSYAKDELNRLSDRAPH
jgi:hypothetical protein